MDFPEEIKRIRAIAIPVDLSSQYKETVCPVCGEPFEYSEKIKTASVSPDSIEDRVCMIGTSVESIRLFFHEYEEDSEEEFDEEEAIEIDIS